MYYPKSQISTPLYTNGDKFLLNDKPYIGNYWINSKGINYTGKSPQDPPNLKLSLPVNFDSTREEPSPPSYYRYSSSYYKSKNKTFNISAPTSPLSSITFPTEDDYQTGEFQRYFARKRNEFKYIEINKDTYQKYINKDQGVQWQLYAPIQINWILTGKRGKVYNINKNIVLLYQQQNNIFGFLESFKNKFTRYFKYLPAENLETDGTEFKNKRTGKAYMGSYHIHPTKGPMVGAKHILAKHDFLTEIEEILDNKISVEVSGSSYQRKIPQTVSGGSLGGY